MAVKRVLIAEDDTAILDVVKIILGNEGYEIKSIDNGDQIFKLIHSFKPDLLLLDIWLSGHNGGEIAKKLKSNKETSSIPIVIISANNETEKIAKTAGADDFLQKPFDIDDLLAVTKKYLSSQNS